ncbi:MAG: Glu/Leu/Phe/Val dehydrogenase [Parachlamydiaceae bacterium]|nr:Glu/Leu/Phe/Val dehydrogenase [Parachlamydiaceae bacterium]
MLTIKEIPTSGYQRVIEAIDPEANLHCFIAIHNNTLGPALGGTRMYPYPTPNDALQDVLRLAKGMTYKSALAEDGLGGGKSVIIGDPVTQKRDRLLLAFGEVLNYLQGQYIAAEDVGTAPEDMIVIRRKSPYVVALPTERSSGDPSRFTAHGVFRGMQAVAKKLWNNPSLAGKTIAIQGLGHVGSKLADILFWEGANLIFSDLDKYLLHHLSHLYGAKTVSPEAFFKTPCDILSPCAMGNSINSTTLPQLQCKAIAGSANNQLENPSLGAQLTQKNILYAPDCIINSGGIINAAIELDPTGYNPIIAREKVNRIYDRLLSLFEKAEHENKPTSQAADEMAEYNLKHLIGKRMTPLNF